MRLFFGILAGLVLAISIAAGAAFIACDGSLTASCAGKDVRISLDNHDND